MVAVSRATLSQGPGATRRLFGAMLAAMALLAMTLAFGGEAKACPQGTNANSARSIVHKVKQAAAMHANPTFVSSHTQLNDAAVRACCGGAHGGGSGCQAGSCPACAPALAAPTQAPQPPDEAVAYGLSVDDAFPSIKSSPQFRPPRHVA